MSSRGRALLARAPFSFSYEKNICRYNGRGERGTFMASLPGIPSKAVFKNWQEENPD